MDRVNKLVEAFEKGCQNNRKVGINDDILSVREAYDEYKKNNETKVYKDNEVEEFDLNLGSMEIGYIQEACCDRCKKENVGCFCADTSYDEYRDVNVCRMCLKELLKL